MTDFDLKDSDLYQQINALLCWLTCELAQGRGWRRGRARVMGQVA